MLRRVVNSGTKTPSLTVVGITHSIQSGPTPIQSSNSLSLSLQWLTCFSALVELPTGTSGPDLTTLLTADIPMLVLNPIVTPLAADLQSPLYRTVRFGHPHAVLVIIGIETPETRAVLHPTTLRPSFNSFRTRSWESGRRELRRFGQSDQRLSTSTHHNRWNPYTFSRRIRVLCRWER